MIKLAEGWRDYEIIATGDGQKLERWGGLYLLRPDPQIIWRAPFPLSEYEGINAVYRRNSAGGGAWEMRAGVPDSFKISRGGLVFNCKLMGFKHTGVFPEQAVNWDALDKIIAASEKKPRVLNLFAYTGGATAACAKAGAQVCHVDSARAMVDRAKLNCRDSGVKQENLRFIVDDCLKFVTREARRGSVYDAVIMDPPSYGRGAGGEIWKLEDDLFSLVEATMALLSPNPLFYLINSYTTGLQPAVIKNILDINLCGADGKSEAYEVGLPTGDKNVALPCGCSGLWTGANRTL